MIITPLSPTEAARLEALRQYGILDTAAEQAFDDLTLIAAQICGTPIALISLIDERRQWFKSRVGLAAQETHRDQAFCAHAILRPDLFVVGNALEDERFAANPLVTGEPHIRFYAGAPLVTASGDALGTLCVIDREPRELSAAQREALCALSRQVMTHLELRLNAAQLALVSGELAGEVAERRRAEESLWQAHDELERRVGERTAELLQANRSLEDQIAERTRVEQALRTSEERHRTLLQSLPQSVFFKDHRSVFISVNAAFAKELGVRPEEVVGKSDYDFFPEELASKYRADDLRVMTTRQAETIEEINIAHGQRRVVEVVKTPVTSDGDTVIGVLGLVTDITKRKRAEQQLLHNAFHDELTGLPNRALFMDRLKLAFDRSKRRNRSYQFAVLFLDLNRFKFINDSLGHAVGDQLLIGIAERLKACLRSVDTVARLGGDEFTVLLDDIHDPAEASGAAERLQQELSKPFTFGEHEVSTTVSIGIAPGRIDHGGPEEVLRDADTAMYRAKVLGKARHEVFDKTMHAAVLDRLQLETDLRRAIEQNEFRLDYQPIVTLDTGRICGFEALVRWQHPKHGRIPPGDFIPVAEETGMIIPLGHWVLAEACRQVSRWQAQVPRHTPLQVSVNISAKQFTQLDFIKGVVRALQEARVDPRNLKLEITESIMMQNIDTAVSMLKQLRALGVELSLDDFGTGYSSLSYLHRLPLSTIKIDRSFVSRMTDSRENAEIVRTMLVLARNLGMGVVAEGIETEQQLAQLRAQGCECGQGYLFSRPLDAEAATRLLAKAPAAPLAPAHPGNIITCESLPAS